VGDIVKHTFERSGREGIGRIEGGDVAGGCAWERIETGSFLGHVNVLPEIRVERDCG
jgi:hypothetical protein